MKKLLTIVFLIIASSSLAQLVDGVYKPSKITVSGGVITAIDSIPETDPTVSLDVKNISTLDQNHWNDAYIKMYDYPSWSLLVSYILTMWIPQSTDNLGEGTTNLYFTNSRFDTRFGSKSTDNLTEGLANKYFSNSLARASISASSPLTYNAATGALGLNSSNILPSIGTTGQMLRVGSGGLEYFSPTFLTGNQNITLSGDVTGSGTTLISATLSNTGVTPGTYDWATVDAKGRVTAAGNAPAPTSIASGARNFNQAYQVSATRPSNISLSSSLSCNLSLSGGQSGTVTLEISANGTSGWIYIGQIDGSNTGTLTVGLNTTQITGGQLSTDLPAGYYWRLTTTNAVGTPTYSFKGGNFTIY